MSSDRSTRDPWRPTNRLSLTAGPDRSLVRPDALSPASCVASTCSYGCSANSLCVSSPSFDCICFYIFIWVDAGILLDCSLLVPSSCSLPPTVPSVSVSVITSLVFDTFVASCILISQGVINGREWRSDWIYSHLFSTLPFLIWPKVNVLFFIIFIGDGASRTFLRLINERIYHVLNSVIWVRVMFWVRINAFYFSFISCVVESILISHSFSSLPLPCV